MTTTTQIPEDVIAKVRADNPGVELHLLGNEFGQAIFRVPPKATFERYLTEMMETETRVQAFRTIVNDSLVYPDKEGMAALLKERPGLLTTFAGELSEIAGVKRASISRKL